MTINPKEFLSEPEELHALIIGLCEVIAFWPPRHEPAGDYLIKDVYKEYHYYQLGRGLGVICWLGLAAAIKGILF